MTTLISLISLFGITPDRYPFAVLGILIIAGVLFIKVSLGKPIKNIKDNILVIVTHLATSRSKLNPSLIKQMSPLQIQPEGKKILEESGFIEIINSYSNKVKFFNIIAAKNPSTKLEVESCAILAFLEMLAGEGVMNEIKAYLYQRPDIRDTFPTLAGVYIRDVYLSEHSEIIK